MICKCEASYINAKHHTFPYICRFMLQLLLLPKDRRTDFGTPEFRLKVELGSSPASTVNSQPTALLVISQRQIFSPACILLILSPTYMTLSSKNLFFLGCKCYDSLIFLPARTTAKDKKD